jgi:quercetin dioxygenase-like cupin family protein
MPDPDPWPSELDAVVAAPLHHVVLFENDSVRVLENRLAPGETVPLHCHCWPASLYVLGWSDIVRRDARGTLLMDSRTLTTPAKGAILWSPAMAPHTLQNVGQSELWLICVEVKTATAAAG